MWTVDRICMYMVHIHGLVCCLHIHCSVLFGKQLSWNVAGSVNSAVFDVVFFVFKISVVNDKKCFSELVLIIFHIFKRLIT